MLSHERIFREYREDFTALHCAYFDAFDTRPFSLFGNVFNLHCLAAWTRIEGIAVSFLLNTNVRDNIPATCKEQAFPWSKLSL